MPSGTPVAPCQLQHAVSTVQEGRAVTILLLQQGNATPGTCYMKKYRVRNTHTCRRP